MKHVGLNVAADPLFTIAYTGINAGMIIGVADDAGMHSSQNEQDSRHYAKASKVPMLEPSDSAEALEFTKLAYEISEEFDTAVIVKMCTRVSHSQSIVETSDRVEFKKDYEKNLAKIKEAVYGTAGEIITYRGEAIDAMYHASAGGATENSEDVYKNEIAYIRGVESPDTEGYEETISYSHAEFAEKINTKLGTSLRADSLAEELEIISRYESGRIERIRIGDKTFSGSKFRGAAGLPSAMFTYELTEENIVFTVKGYGHGVGMSQSGANHYAKQGMDYREILHHYYTDVEIEAAAES